MALASHSILLFVVLSIIIECTRVTLSAPTRTIDEEITPLLPKLPRSNLADRVGCFPISPPRWFTCQCIWQCFHIRQKSRSLINEMDNPAAAAPKEPDLVYCYLQAREHRRSCRKFSLIYGSTILGLFALPVTLTNHWKHWQTERGLEKAIKEHYGAERMARIKKLQYTHDSMRSFYSNSSKKDIELVDLFFLKKLL